MRSGRQGAGKTLGKDTEVGDWEAQEEDKGQAASRDLKWKVYLPGICPPEWRDWAAMAWGSSLESGLVGLGEADGGAGNQGGWGEGLDGRSWLRRLGQWAQVEAGWQRWRARPAARRGEMAAPPVVGWSRVPTLEPACLAFLLVSVSLLPADSCKARWLKRHHITVFTECHPSLWGQGSCGKETNLNMWTCNERLCCEGGVEREKLRFHIHLLDWVISDSLSWAYSKPNFFSLWQLLIYLHLDGLLEDEWKRSWVTLLPSVKAVFRSIQQQVLVKKPTGTLTNRQNNFFICNHWHST